MLFIDEINNFEKFKRIYKFKNKILKKIENKSENISNFLYKIIFFYMRNFNKNIKKVVSIEEDGLKVYLIYLVHKNKIREKRIYQIIYMMKRQSMKRIVLSDTLNKNENIKNIFYSNNIDILDGKILYESLIYKMLEYISVVQKKRLETYEVSIMINDKSEQRLSNISKIISKCKLVNIITNNPKQFDKLKENMKNEYGIILNITTNIDKSLVKSDIIINYDFVSEIYSKCTIPKRAIAFNVNENIKVHSNTFDGINITGYMIYLPPKYKKAFDKMENFNPCLFYEAIILEENMIQSEIERKINNENIKIRYFVGNNDKIRGREFLNLNKNKIDVRKNDKRLDKKI